MLFCKHLENVIKQQTGHAQILVQEVTYLYMQISKHL